MQIDDTALSGVKVLTPRRFADARGWFTESWNRETLRAQGLDLDFVQDNHSLSRAAGTVRGLHYQRPPHAQAKLLRVIAGAILDVAVDVRRGSPTYGRWVAEELSAENGRQLLVPEGFLHGFVTRAPDTQVVYKCTDVYAPDCDGAVAWDDPEIGIDWGIDPETAVLSDKDRAAPRLSAWQSPFAWEDAQ
ncbi:dTDP-4-dehydrorhamnose 3,5-epimerase [Rubellimicrobium roseum]|uniref:dTDP-4-dehydrorhamnose 3,5-epimerase n=1 Tax=Rubellimicrobium roseum TaxID=687525 RepID=A0A5C4NQ65_9RHOB|nr:dTDP-4-dehydrorhamnose 3,5-epimerase [Rubellimicrobium roseum]TNC74807.1 dTDP-4-dehydrorhamnose 3,5-epimerase [Rubellimicrobium roseum]